MAQYVRLTKPMVRVNGELREASWDEALDRAGERLPHESATATAAMRSGSSRARRRATR